MKIQCSKCRRILENPNWNPKDTCKFDGGFFQPINYNPNTPQFPMNYPSPLPNVNELPEIPHIYLGKGGFSTKQVQNPIQPQNNKSYLNRNVNSPVQINPKEERIYNLYEKIRIYGFYVLLSLVIGYAGYRIIKLFIGG